MTTIRRVRGDEWVAMRSLRLHALADTPTAFGSTLAKEQAYTDDMWRERCLGVSQGCERATFIAERDGTWVGTVTGLADPPTPDGRSMLLIAMFVTADARRDGIGAALVEALTAWAQACGIGRIALWVASDNVPGSALYRRCGFLFSGVTKPHSHVPGLTEREMVRLLDQ